MGSFHFFQEQNTGDRLTILLIFFQSEKRKQDLLAEILLEEQRGRELSKIVKELLPDSKDTASVEKPSRARKVFSMLHSTRVHELHSYCHVLANLLITYILWWVVFLAGGSGDKHFH